MIRRGPYSQDIRKFIPFAEVALESEQSATWHVGPKQGSLSISVPVAGGLAYLRGIEITTDDGAIENVRLMDTNGASIFDLTGELFTLMGSYIPLQINDTGLGCLPNMSAAYPYRLEIRGKGQGRITYQGRALPEQVNMLGVPQAQLPPHSGTSQYWSNVIHYPIPAGVQHRDILRVGNYIKEIILLFKDRKPFCITDLTLQWDDRYFLPEEINIDHCATGVYEITFPMHEYGIPTVQSTRLRLTFESPYEGTLDIAVNDMYSAPTPFGEWRV